MQFSESYLIAAIAVYMWPFIRIAACLMAMFTIGSQSVPVLVRLALAVAVTWCMCETIPHPKFLDPFSVTGFLTVGREFLIGITIGFITQFIAQIFVVAGQVIAMQTGLGFASLVDPVSGTNTPVVGQFFTVLTTLLFLVIDGHLMLLRMLRLSFFALPISATMPGIPWTEIASFGSLMFVIALGLSISSICAMLLVNFTFGVMTRAAPQLNIFSLGFAISMLAGLIILKMVLSGFWIHFEDAMNRVFNLGCTILGTSCPNVF